MKTKQEKMKRIRVKVGDVCAIPLGNGYYAYAHSIDDVIKDGRAHYYVIYDHLSNIFPELQELTKNNIIVLICTVDVFIENHSWPLVGNIAPPSGITIPNYIVNRFKDGNEQIMVVDHHGKYLREATIDDKRNLSYQSSFSPIVLEDVAKYKLLGKGRYLPYMDKIFYSGTK